MKRIVVIMMTLLTFGGGAAAQDTIWDASLSSDYLTTDDNWIVSDTGFVGSGGEVCRLQGKYFFTQEKTLRVYGIAAMLDKPHFRTEFPDPQGYYLSNYFVDTTLDNSCEAVAIHAAGPDSLTLVSEQKWIHCKNSVPAYYLGTNMYNPYKEKREREIHPVYEVYFDMPVDVTDSFYVTMTRESWRKLDGTDAPRDTVNHCVWSAWPIGPVTYGAVYRDSTYQLHQVYGEHGLVVSSDGEYIHKWGLGKIFLFPILIPNPDAVDTTSADTTHTDTLGIAMRTVERYVNLLPNPASERVQVTSSFGLRGIEVYNAAGVKVQEQRAVGYTATLDISALPEGSYLVRVATPSGTVTKKLVVQRR